VELRSLSINGKNYEHNGPCDYLKHGVTKDAFIALQTPAIGAQVLWLVCLHLSIMSVYEDIAGNTCVIFTKFLVHVAYGCGSIFSGEGGKVCYLQLPCWCYVFILQLC